MSPDSFKNPLYLVITGTLLASTVLLSRHVAGFGVPMLWFLSFALMGGGAILLIFGIIKGQFDPKNLKSILIYSLGAGLFHAVPNTMAYMSVLHVGTGFVTLAYAFPLLVTYLITLTIGMDKYNIWRLTAVFSALAGGLMIASAKFDGLKSGGDSTFWVLMASSIPFIIAFGNIYRTKYWPEGGKPLGLASLMLICAGVALLPLALSLQGTDQLPSLFANHGSWLVLNIVLFALQFVFYFKLQLEAGPVYLSQIGSVSAAVGIPFGVIIFGESLPEIFVYAIVLIIIGVVLFQKAPKNNQ